MPIYDRYAPYRDHRLTPEEQQILDGAEVRPRDPSQLVSPQAIAHAKIAMGRAEEQLRGFGAIPEDLDVAIRYPAVDPVGRYSCIDCRFAQRERVVQAALQMRPPEVASYGQLLLDSRKEPGPVQALKREMEQASKTHRTLTRAEKLCLDPEGRAFLHQAARSLELSQPVLSYDLFLQGLEHLAGVRKEPLSQEVDQFYRKQLNHPLSPHMLTMSRETPHSPKTLDIPFAPFRHRMVHQLFAQPEHWGLRPEELSVQLETLTTEEVAQAIPSYARASAAPTLNAAFAAAPPEAPHRADLILIDGLTVREHLERQGVHESTPEEANHFTADLVSCALLSNRQVEAFLPDPRGQLSRRPTQLTASGYRPDPLHYALDRAWEGHGAKFGFYGLEPDGKERMRRIEAGRERLYTRFAPLLAPEERSQAALEEAVTPQAARNVALAADALVRGQLLQRQLESSFGKGEGETPRPEVFQAGPTTLGTYVVGKLVDQGYASHQILNPAQLLEEKQMAATRFGALAREGNVEAYARDLRQALPQVLDQMDQLQARVDGAERQMEQLPQLLALGRVALDMRKTLDTTPCRAFTGADLAQDLHLQRRQTAACSYVDQQERGLTALVALAADHGIPKEGPQRRLAVAHHLSQLITARFCQEKWVQQNQRTRGGCGLELQSSPPLDAIAAAVGNSPQLKQLASRVVTPGAGRMLAARFASGDFDARYRVDISLNGKSVEVDFRRLEGKPEKHRAVSQEIRKQEPAPTHGNREQTSPVMQPKSRGFRP